MVGREEAGQKVALPTGSPVLGKPFALLPPMVIYLHDVLKY